MGQSSAGFSLEAHYYDGGLKEENFPNPRPVSGLPASEHVIYADTPNLGKDDLTFELCLIPSDQNENWVWLGCYAASSDRQFGDRSNYVGVGIWMRDFVAIDCRSILRSLAQATADLNKEGMTTSLHNKFLEFESVIRDEYLLVRDELPSGLVGMTRSSSGESGYREFEILGPLEAAIADVEAAVLNLQLAPAPFVPNTKVRFKIVSALPQSNSPSLLPALPELFRPLVFSLPKVVEETAKTLIQVKEQYSELKSVNESMRAQLDSFRNAADRVNIECDALKLKITEQGEELDRLRALPLTIINTQLSEISRRLEILNVAPPPSEAPIRPTKIPRPIEPIGEPSTDIKLALKLLQYFLIIVLVIGIVGAIAYGILFLNLPPFDHFLNYLLSHRNAFDAHQTPACGSRMQAVL